MSYRLDFTDLVNEARDRNTIMTFYDSGTNECFHVFPNGLVESFDCQAGHLTSEDLDALMAWSGKNSHEHPN